MNESTLERIKNQIAQDSMPVIIYWDTTPEYAAFSEAFVKKESLEYDKNYRDLKKEEDRFMRGDCSELYGDCSELYGNCLELSGDYKNTK